MPASLRNLVAVCVIFSLIFAQGVPLATVQAAATLAWQTPVGRARTM